MIPVTRGVSRLVAPEGERHVRSPLLEYANPYINVLDADLDLASCVSASTLASARPFVVAPTELPETGPWTPPRTDRDPATHLGLLVLQGFLVREVRVIDRPSTELLGAGDLLRPWEPDRGGPFSIRSRWDVLEPTHVAILDGRFTAMIGRWPDLVAAILGRAVARSRALALYLAIGQIVRVELRLLMILWYIAERWGRSDANRIVVPVGLTHQMLASLVGAQRPTVTRALRTLTERKLIDRRADGHIVLTGDPPIELLRMRASLA